MQCERVTRVIDGDTFETTNRTVRLEDVDTPEAGQLGAEEATNALKGLISGKFVNIDVKAHDTYRRAVAQVWVDGKSVNDFMKQYNK